MVENTIYNLDCLVGMADLNDDSVDMVITSPPYDNLRTYKDKIDECWGEHIWKPIIKELHRILKPGGVAVWVVADATIDGGESGTSFRQALFFQECGFKIYDTMIYQKKNPIPQNHKRYEQCWEYMFVFSKGKPSVFNGITVETVNGGKVMDWGGRKTSMDAKQCRRDVESNIRVTKGTKLHNNIFTYSIGGGNSGHPAVFPLKLAVDQVKTWSNPGDIILDPFMGSGTTAMACLMTDRKYIGYEISKDYYESSLKRLEKVEELEDETEIPLW